MAAWDWPSEVGPQEVARAQTGSWLVNIVSYYFLRNLPPWVLF